MSWSIEKDSTNRSQMYLLKRLPLCNMWHFVGGQRGFVPLVHNMHDDCLGVCDSFFGLRLISIFWELQQICRKFNHVDFMVKCIAESSTMMRLYWFAQDFVVLILRYLNYETSRNHGNL